MPEEEEQEVGVANYSLTLRSFFMVTNCSVKHPHGLTNNTSYNVTGGKSWGCTIQAQTVGP